MNIQVEIILSDKNLDLDTLHSYLCSMEKWSIYWYEIINVQTGALFIFLSLEFSYKSPPDDRESLIYEILEIFDDIKVLALGYGNLWSTTIFSENGIQNLDKMYFFKKNKESETFLSLAFLSYIDTPLLMRLLLPVKNFFYKMEWYMYHMLTKEDIKNYFTGTFKRNKKSTVYSPLRVPLHDLLDSTNFNNIWNLVPPSTKTRNTRSRIPVRRT